MTKIMDGKRLSEKILLELKDKIKRLDRKPGLATILIGEDPSSIIYVNKKEDICKNLGIYSEGYDLPENVKDADVLELIRKLNENEKIDGILVQLPLPNHLNRDKILDTILPRKDVDGLTSLSLGNLLKNVDGFVPCTPKGVMKLLEEYKIDVEGKNVVIVNHSVDVGKPLSLMMLNKNATVVVCHVKTVNLKTYTRNADILITATGIPRLIKEDMIKIGAVVIDAGICRKGEKVLGDVDFENVSKVADYITPVPGGVGPMTVGMLMENTLHAFRLCRNHRES